MTKQSTIVKMIYGSHLYGTSTPESDQEYKGVYMPSKRDIYIGRISRSLTNNTKKDKGEGVKNTPNDIDDEFYSLHHFISLACEGQTVALDMLHAPDDMILKKNWIWDEIIKNREKFYTKNLKAFIGYARRQAAKYGIKGSRLDDAKRFIDALSGSAEESRLADIWGSLPRGEHIYYPGKDRNNIEQVQICGKTFQATSRISYTLPIITNFYENYGKRAQQAANNENIDWKAISHAVRAALQVKELLIDNTITFPLKDAQVVTDIKFGKLDYTTEVTPLLDTLIDEVEELSRKSTLPEKTDRKYWDDFIIRVVQEELS
jgi:hypothetical protein